MRGLALVIEPDASLRGSGAAAGVTDEPRRHAATSGDDSAPWQQQLVQVDSCALQLTSMSDVDAAHVLQTRIAAFVREFGLLQPDQTPCGMPVSVSMAHTLADLSEAEGLSQTELAVRLRLEKSTVSRLVAELRQRGWIERRRDQTDGRVVRLFLTPEGRAQADRLQAARAVRFGQLAGRLSNTDRAAVEHALDLLVRALRPAGPAAPDSTTVEEQRHVDQTPDAQ